MKIAQKTRGLRTTMLFPVFLLSASLFIACGNDPDPEPTPEPTPEQPVVPTPEPEPKPTPESPLIEFGNAVTAVAFAGGDGSSADKAFEISEAGHLKKLVDDVNKGVKYENTFFKLMKDIRVSADEWIPIGKNYEACYFAGCFDGNGKRVQGTLKSDNYAYFGFFGSVRTQYGRAEVKNLHIEANVNSGFHGGGTALVGAVAGAISKDCEISECSFSGTLTGIGISIEPSGNSYAYMAYLGGLVGAVSSGSVTNCAFTGKIDATDIIQKADGTQIGGIAGDAFFATITHCTVSDAEIKGGRSEGKHAYSAGGIAGATSRGTISDCQVIRTPITGGDVRESSSSTGGIAGNDGYQGTIANCIVSECTLRGGSGGAISATGGILGGTGETILTDCQVSHTEIIGGNGDAPQGAFFGNGRESNTGGVTARMDGEMIRCEVTECHISGGAALYEANTSSSTGGLAAYNRGAISQSTVNGGTVTGGAARKNYGNEYMGTSCAGGITGVNYNEVSFCSSSAQVTGGSGNAVYTGGVIGQNQETGALGDTGSVHMATHTGEVTGGSDGTYVHTGGVVGWINNGTLVYDCCTHAGNVNGRPASESNRVGSGSLTPCPEH